MPKERQQKKEKGEEEEEKRELAGRVDILDTMIVSLAELLEEKGMISQVEWEQKIRKSLKA